MIQGHRTVVAIASGPSSFPGDDQVCHIL